MSRQARLRVIALVAVVVTGQVALTLLDFDPDPLRWALVATGAMTSWWLVLDVLSIGAAPWDRSQAAYARPDAADDSVHHRVVTNHLAARDPGPALRHLLVGLAQTRDPELQDPRLRALADAPPGRLAPADIDRYLRIIEEPESEEPESEEHHDRP